MSINEVIPEGADLFDLAGQSEPLLRLAEAVDHPGVDSAAALYQGEDDGHRRAGFTESRTGLGKLLWRAGVHPELGRTFTEGENRRGQDRVVILAHSICTVAGLGGIRVTEKTQIFKPWDIAAMI